MNPVWEQVDEYIVDRLCPNDRVLDEVIVANRKADLPEIDVTANQGKFCSCSYKSKGRNGSWKSGRWGPTARYGWLEA